MKQLKKLYPRNGSYYVYVLMRGEKPVYVGCTKNVYDRVRAHKTSKDFDSVFIHFWSLNKLEALTTERKITILFSCCGIDLYNKLGTKKQKMFKDLKPLKIK